MIYYAGCTNNGFRLKLIVSPVGFVLLLYIIQYVSCCAADSLARPEASTYPYFRSIITVINSAGWKYFSKEEKGKKLSWVLATVLVLATATVNHFAVEKRIGTYLRCDLLKTSVYLCILYLLLMAACLSISTEVGLTGKFENMQSIRHRDRLPRWWNCTINICPILFVQQSVNRKTRHFPISAYSVFVWERPYSTRIDAHAV